MIKRYFYIALFSAVVFALRADIASGQNIILPRAEAIGGSTSLSGEYLSTLTNPACIGGIDGIKFGFAFELTRHDKNTPYVLGAVIPLSEKMSFGIGWYRYLNEQVGIKLRLSDKDYFTYKNSLSINNLHIASSFRISDRLTAGLGVSAYGRRTISDTVAIISQTNITEEDYHKQDISGAELRLGIIYDILPNLQFGLVMDNIVSGQKSRKRFNDEIKNDYRFHTLFSKKFSEVFSRFGFTFAPSKRILLDTEIALNRDGRGSRYFQRGGAEIMVMKDFWLRVGTKYVDKLPHEIINMPIVGFGWYIQGLSVDYFTDRGDFHQIGLSYQADIRDKLIEILSVEKVKNSIFPALAPIYAQKPIVVVRVRNTGDSVEKVRASFYIRKIMDSRSYSSPYEVEPGGSIWIPVQASFNDNILKIDKIEVFDAEVVVEPLSGNSGKDLTSVRYVVQGKNDWDGNPETLKYFLTPADPFIVKFTRDLLSEHIDRLSQIKPNLRTLERARILFDSLSGSLSYSNDPQQLVARVDRVQTPMETISLKTGDCDDLTVLFSTLLNSIGISTAFIDVTDPESKDGAAHIYLMFDTEIPYNESHLVSSNEKKFIIRPGAGGKKTVWIPVETTLVSRGFEEAWGFAALDFYNDAYIKLGLLKNWVKIVDVQ